MGLFTDMGNIRKVYKILAALEVDVNDYLAKSKSDPINHHAYMENKKADIIYRLRELSNLERSGGNTILYADFQFMGYKNRLGDIIRITYELVQ